MKKLFHCIILISILSFCDCSRDNKGIIDRQALVERHKVISEKLDFKSPMQVGNGKFAFSVDITGLQTFVPFNIMSDWGWHSDPVPEGMKVENFKGKVVETHGRPVRYPLPNDENEEQKELSKWLAGNPHRIDLGRLAFSIKKADGSQAQAADLQNLHQELNLWTGIISSYFEIDSIPVNVKTVCHPDMDIIGVTIESELLKTGRLSVILEFPYASAISNNPSKKVDYGFKDYVGIWDQPKKHQTEIYKRENRVDFTRVLDDDKYYASIKWFTEIQFKTDTTNPHRFKLLAQGNNMQFVCAFSPDIISDELPNTMQCLKASEMKWPKYWRSGAAIDLSGSTDPRWKELERRIVLSQYLMKVNEAGSWPPQESGLVNNGWYGRFHFEMFWWHGVHWALWNRWEQLERSLEVYHKFLKQAQIRAEGEGYLGARWPKCTAYNATEWPHPCHAFIIWQQPHVMYFAEMDYRLHPTRETLEKWQDIVSKTADFLASYAFYDEKKGSYVLGPPLVPVSENTDFMTTINPAFELSYWRFGLRIAVSWQERLGITPPEKWKQVLKNLAPLPVENNLYILHEGLKNMWSEYNFEHPALIGTYGMLPGDGVDLKIFERTFNQVLSMWDFKRVWGWDFPMLAMAAVRLNKPEMAIELLLHDNFKFDQNGLSYGGPFPYFPSNGGLLAVIAMMAGGWDGAPEIEAPGFPKNGKWNVKYEGFNRML